MFGDLIGLLFGSYQGAPLPKDPYREQCKIRAEEILYQQRAGVGRFSPERLGQLRGLERPSNSQMLLMANSIKKTEEPEAEKLDCKSWRKKYKGWYKDKPKYKDKKIHI